MGGQSTRPDLAASVASGAFDICLEAVQAFAAAGLEGSGHGRARDQRRDGREGGSEHEQRRRHHRLPRGGRADAAGPGLQLGDPPELDRADARAMHG